MPRKKKKYEFNSVAVIGNYLPRLCGIATFTTDLCNALSEKLGNQGDVLALAMDDIAGGYSYPERVKFQLRANVQSDYLRAADFLNVYQFDVVILQHEFGIFGGKQGAHILHLLKHLRMPILTTLHTVLTEPTDEQRVIIHELAKYSERFVVMSNKARNILLDTFAIPELQIQLIPHGIPDVAFADPSFHKDQFGVEDRKVILSFGLLSPSKGIEHMIDAMPEILAEHPDAVYIILGATHPHVKMATGDAYRHGLLQKVSMLGLEDHVLFHNQFVSLEVLVQYLGAADIYVTPYISPAQVTSGALAYAVGSGKAVVSTPYWHAEELLAEKRGRLVPFGDPGAMAREISELLGNDLERNTIRKRAYQYARPMVWNEVARQYLELAVSALDRYISSPRPAQSEARTPKILDELPEVNLAHLRSLTDDTGMLQHANYSTPNRYHGYCVDDNARALIATSMYYDMRRDESVILLIHKYLAFLFHAFDRKTERFHNFMSYERTWLEKVGSEDSHARAIWGLGVGMKYAPNDAIRDMATRLFLEALSKVVTFSSPRAWAFILVGLHAYLDVYGGDAGVRRLRALLAEKLHNLFENTDETWPWCEETVTYANAKLPHALILSGQWIPDTKMHETGIKLLEWLLEQQTTPDGHLSVIGNSGWLTRGGIRSNFDQQPIDIMALVEACAEAFRSTGDRKWLVESRRGLAWFLGRNDLHAVLYDFKTAGCRDGLQPHGLNANQGAESTLAWLISLLTMFEILGQEVLVSPMLSD
ncbi:MAG: glycosyltransferase family 4 protein [Planctomycetota bacterium]|jgi:glycosyltransferase involved in cell wall biosynthesis